MNYWPRWINAIKKRTGALSLAEMGAYDRLLDHYYAEEQPLPLDLEKCCRLAVALTKDERKAVEKVLAEFFTRTDVGYTNERADEEIALAAPKIAAAQANGKRGGRPKGSGKKPAGFPAGTQEEPESKAPHPHPQKRDTENHPDLAGEGGQVPDVSGHEPTQAGAVCRAIRRAGIPDVNPGHPRLLALLQAGATEAEFIGFAEIAKDRDSPFAYLLAMVEGERKRAASGASQLHRGAMPPPLPTAKEQRQAATVRAWMGSALNPQPEEPQHAPATALR